MRSRPTPSVSMVRRRLSLAAFATSLVAAPLPAARAQQGPRPARGQHRVAFINVGPAGPNALNIEAFRSGLADLGYVEGRNLELDVRWAGQRADRLPALVAELLERQPAVIVSTGGPVTARAVKAATDRVPIVALTGDHVAEGLVSTLARPGGNVTGIAVLAGELEAKRIEILAQMLPRARRVAAIWNPAQQSVEVALSHVDEAARRYGLTILKSAARNREELIAALADVPRGRPDAFFVVSDPLLGFERARIVDFAATHRLPAVYFWREFVDIGGLASYGTSLTAVYRRAASYVDRVLKGTPPGDLPVEQPQTFEFVLNLRTAHALGLTLPRDVLRRADETIE